MNDDDSTDDLSLDLISKNWRRKQEEAQEM